MADLNEVQAKIAKVFADNFGITPLTERLSDIEREHRELQRYTNLNNLREESGDLLASVLQLCNEAGWNAGDLVAATLEKIQRRSLQYKTLGRKLRVALLGGAFNMPHLGHIALAQLVLRATKHDEVWLVPCFAHLGGKKLASPNHRLEMVRLACKCDLRLKAFDYEIKKELQGETYHFIKLLKEDPVYDNVQFSYIIGQDNADHFHTWYNYEELERLIPFIVTPRAGYERDTDIDWYLRPPHSYLVREAVLPHIASKELRSWFWYDEAMVEKYIDPLVAQYIRDNNLYRDEW